MRALRPGADHTDDDAEDDADDRQFQRHPQAFDDAGGLRRVIEIDEIPLRVRLRQVVEILLESVH